METGQLDYFASYQQYRVEHRIVTTCTALPMDRGFSWITALATHL